MKKNKIKVLVLGGKPIASIDIVRYVQSIGHYAIVCDFLPKDKSPAKLFADEVWGYSTADIENIVAKAKSVGVGAVFTGVHDFNIVMCREVATRLGLPFYATAEQLRITMDKKYYKELFNEHSIPVVPEFFIGEESWERDIKYIQYPVLIKPSDGSGGCGISICYREDDFRGLYKNALNFSREKKIIVEKFIQEEEVTIFYVVQDGDVLLSAMADRHVVRIKGVQTALPVLYTFPSKYLRIYQETLNAQVIDALKKIGLSNGMVFIQSFFVNQNFMFYDMGFRLTGTQEYHLIENICGFNPLKMMVDYSIGAAGGVKDFRNLVNPWFNDKKAAIITFLARPGKIGKYLGLEEVEQISGVIKVIKNYAEGDIISESAIGTLNQVVLRVLIVADTEEVLINLIKRVKTTARVVDENGDSILLPITQ